MHIKLMIIVPLKHYDYEDMVIYNENTTEFCLLKVVAHWPKGSHVESQQGSGQASGCSSSEFQIPLCSAYN